MKRTYLTAGACSILALVLCSAVAIGAPEKSVSKPAAKAKPATAEDLAAPAGILSGKVIETMDAGGYTYVQIEKKGKKSWVAIPETKVAVGKEMSFQPGNEMKHFSSKTLNRTFDSIIFSPGIAEKASTAAAMPAGHGDMAASAGSKPAAAVKDVKVEKAKGPNSYTVAEVFEKASSLNGKTAVVRATVVKVSSGIMGTNWLHLQDGTGSSAKSTHDLVVTTNDAAQAGDVVTVKGTVAKDKDFGSGYKYSAIIEKASIQR